ncbi:MAG TPA: F0F1 ATP synthase subunit A [Streptosporangiaceae bacterium]|jgi:F-type H+-transporting ATPase subunit a|nr:F0F1 ATP synthase subunit A [Streptosporangiaceae bacterium]
MSDVHLMTTASGCHFQSKPSCGFPAPSINDFFFKPAFSIGGVGFTKPILLMLLSAAIVLLVFWLAFRKPKKVPRGVQNVGELGILFIRDQILRPQMGSKGDRYLPFLVSLFFFIWLMNLWELIPLAQFPATSKFAFPLGLTLVVWVTYMFIGMKHQGPIGYFKNMAVPQGAPWWILPLLSPLELLSNIIVRPFTLSIRLFANMLSGHLLLLVFSIASWYLFTATIGLLFAAVSFIVFLLVFVLEVLITFLQAFIFTTLTSFYISDALESAH